jgi:hypothetical protein
MITNKPYYRTQHQVMTLRKRLANPISNPCILLSYIIPGTYLFLTQF